MTQITIPVTLSAGAFTFEVEGNLTLSDAYPEYDYNNPKSNDENGNYKPGKFRPSAILEIPTMYENQASRHEKKAHPIRFNLMLALMNDRQSINTNNELSSIKSPRHVVDVTTIQIVGVRIDTVAKTLQIEYKFIEYCDKDGKILSQPSKIYGIQPTRMLYGNVGSIGSPGVNDPETYIVHHTLGFIIPW